MEEFQQIVFEIKYSGTTWTDVAADVLHDPPPRGRWGILENGFTDHLADAGEMTFSLDNSASNSHSTLGYYFPGAGSVPFGAEVRVGFKWRNRTKYKWRGFVNIGGVKPIPGIKGPRRVDITCRDWFGLMSDYQLDSIDVTTTTTIATAVAAILAELPSTIQPPNTYYNIGSPYQYPAGFDIMQSGTTVLGELNKWIITEMGFIYPVGNESDGFTLYVEQYKRRYLSGEVGSNIPKLDEDISDLFLLANGTDNLLLADGASQLLLTELTTVSFGDSDTLTERPPVFSYGRHFYNYVKTVITPRRVDAAATTVLWTMDNYIALTAGETITDIKCRYRDPDGVAQTTCCAQGTTPVATTDYKAYANSDGTGTDLTANLAISVTFGTAEATLTLTNTHASTTLYTGGEDILFQLRGKGIYIKSLMEILTNTSSSADTLGRKTVTFDMPYMDSPQVSQERIGDSVFRDARTPFLSCESFPLLANKNADNMNAFMCLDNGMKATFAETLTGYNYVSYINGYSWELVEGKFLFWSPVLLRWDKAPGETT